jgi:SAM-dependent methyltransferase
MYDPARTSSFYDVYGMEEWARLERSAYGRLQAVIHNDFLREHIRSGMRVLDVGCGPGRFSISIARLGARVTLVDISRQQVLLARDHLSEAGLLESVDSIIVGDASRLSMLPDRRFDVVVCYGGALSYVGDRRRDAAAELVRLARPAGVLLVSAMSRYGTASNVVRRPALPLLRDPVGWHLWDVIKTGELPPFPSRIPGLQHPSMHLYTAGELCDLFAGCEILAAAGSNVTAYEGSQALEDLAGDADAWDTIVRLERELCQAPGLVDIGSHIILAARAGT